MKITLKKDEVIITEERLWWYRSVEKERNRYLAATMKMRTHNQRIVHLHEGAAPGSLDYAYLRGWRDAVAAFGNYVKEEGWNE